MKEWEKGDKTVGNGWLKGRRSRGRSGKKEWFLTWLNRLLAYKMKSKKKYSN